MAPAVPTADSAVDDGHVIRGLRSDDPETLRRLMEAFWTPLVGFAHRFLAGSADPEDVVQAAFVKLWTRRSGLAEAGSLRALLFTIVRRACLDELRRKTRRTRAEGSARAPATPRTPYEDIHGAELQRLAAAAVDRLPPRRREVFRLIREEGLSYRDAAEVLGISIQTVANHMCLAMADLRTSLGPYISPPASPGEEGRGTGDGQEPARR